MRRTWAIALVALVCVTTGCADVDPSASTGAYDDEADSHAAERAKVVHADAGQPPAETPDSAPAAPDAGTPAVEPAITATAPDANVAQPAAPDAGTTTAPTTHDAGAPAVAQPTTPALGAKAIYDGRPIRIRNITSTFDWQITIHAEANTQGARDSFDVRDMLTGTDLAPGTGGLTSTIWTGMADGWRITLRFKPDGGVPDGVVVQMWRDPFTVLSDAEAPEAYWVPR